MFRMPFAVQSYESRIIWRFFDGVSSAVSVRMLRGSPPGEENLTFLLCELLDESTTALHALAYPLSKAKEDLTESDIGITLDVGFKTHEHPKYIESKFSGADIGIVLEMFHPILGSYRKAVLVQAKKLFAPSRGKEFELDSEYASYNKDQAVFLDEIQNRFDAPNSIFYLWYNPPLTGFDEEAQIYMRAFEASRDSPSPGSVPPFVDFIEAGVPLFAQVFDMPTVAEKQAKARQWRSTQPALRISDLNTVLAVTKNGVKPQLMTFYEDFMEQGSWLPFVPFADFFLVALLSPRYGNSNEHWVHLAQGQKVSMPPLRAGKQEAEPAALDEPESPPIPHHTITFSLRSTLPLL